jgi:hypothetical protein
VFFFLINFLNLFSKAMEDVLSELDQVQTMEIDENEQALSNAKASYDERMDLLDAKVVLS